MLEFILYYAKLIINYAQFIIDFLKYYIGLVVKPILYYIGLVVKPILIGIYNMFEFLNNEIIPFCSSIIDPWLNFFLNYMYSTELYIAFYNSPFYEIWQFIYVMMIRIFVQMFIGAFYVITHLHIIVAEMYNNATYSNFKDLITGKIKLKLVNIFQYYPPEDILNAVQIRIHPLNNTQGGGKLSYIHQFRSIYIDQTTPYFSSIVKYAYSTPQTIIEPRNSLDSLIIKRDTKVFLSDKELTPKEKYIIDFIKLNSHRPYSYLKEYHLYLDELKFWREIRYYAMNIEKRDKSEIIEDILANEVLTHQEKFLNIILTWFFSVTSMPKPSVISENSKVYFFLLKAIVLRIIEKIYTIQHNLYCLKLYFQNYVIYNYFFKKLRNIAGYHDFYYTNLRLMAQPNVLQRYMSSKDIMVEDKMYLKFRETSAAWYIDWFFLNQFFPILAITCIYLYQDEHPLNNLFIINTKPDCLTEAPNAITNNVSLMIRPKFQNLYYNQYSNACSNTGPFDRTDTDYIELNKTYYKSNTVINDFLIYIGFISLEKEQRKKYAIKMMKLIEEGKQQELRNEEHEKKSNEIEAKYREVFRQYGNNYGENFDEDLQTDFFTDMERLSKINNLEKLSKEAFIQYDIVNKADLKQLKNYNFIKTIFLKEFFTDEMKIKFYDHLDQYFLYQNLEQLDYFIYTYSYRKNIYHNLITVKEKKKRSYNYRYILKKKKVDFDFTFRNYKAMKFWIYYKKIKNKIKKKNFFFKKNFSNNEEINIMLKMKFKQNNLDEKFENNFLKKSFEEYNFKNNEQIKKPTGVFFYKKWRFSLYRQTHTLRKIINRKSLVCQKDDFITKHYFLIRQNHPYRPVQFNWVNNRRKHKNKYLPISNDVFLTYETQIIYPFGASYHLNYETEDNDETVFTDAAYFFETGSGVEDEEERNKLIATSDGQENDDEYITGDINHLLWFQEKDHNSRSRY